MSPVLREHHWAKALWRAEAGSCSVGHAPGFGKKRNEAAAWLAAKSPRLARTIPKRVWATCQGGICTQRYLGAVGCWIITWFAISGHHEDPCLGSNRKQDSDFLPKALQTGRRQRTRQLDEEDRLQMDVPLAAQMAVVCPKFQHQVCIPARCYQWIARHQEGTSSPKTGPQCLLAFGLEHWADVEDSIWATCPSEAQAQEERAWQTRWCWEVPSHCQDRWRRSGKTPCPWQWSPQQSPQELCQVGWVLKRGCWDLLGRLMLVHRCIQHI